MMELDILGAIAQWASGHGMSFRQSFVQELMDLNSKSVHSRYYAPQYGRSPPARLYGKEARP